MTEHRRFAPGANGHALARKRRRPLLHGLVLGLIGAGVLLTVFFPKALSFHTDQPAAISGLSVPNIGVSRQDEPVLSSSLLADTVSRGELEKGLRAIAGETPTPAQDGGGVAGGSQPAATPYSIYAVVEGDTASAIAARYGVDLTYLLAANPDLRDGESLTVGQMLIIPAGNGALYQVRYGETLSDVAARYGVTIDDIINYRGNGIVSADQVSENELVFVPNADLTSSVVPEPAAAPTDSAVSVSAPPDTAPVAAAEGPTSDHGLIWPITGPISSYMGPSHPLGIDIDLYNNPFGAIVAATSGTVTFAGGDPCCSYGYHVIIMSPDGIETVYAHFSSIAVTAGQTVSQGEVLGNAGCTGYCTGNHLHFEVIDNGVRVDPLAYLP